MQMAMVAPVTAAAAAGGITKWLSPFNTYSLSSLLRSGEMRLYGCLLWMYSLSLTIPSGIESEGEEIT